MLLSYFHNYLSLLSTYYGGPKGTWGEKNKSLNISCAHGKLPGVHATLGV